MPRRRNESSMHALSRRAKQDDGFVMVVVLVVVVITVILAGALVQSSVWSSSHGRADYYQKRALAAANSGLQAAIERLSNQAEDNATQLKDCFTTEYVAEASGACPSQHGEVIKGEEYTYYVSPALSLGTNKCTGLWLVVPKEKELTLNLNQRCITSIGTANGAKARVQARVADVVNVTPVANIFPVNGLFSYSDREITNKFTISGEIGAAGKVIASNPLNHSGELTVQYGEEVR